MRGYCPYCGESILSERSNFCIECGRQLREIPPEDASLVAPEEQRHNPMPVKIKFKAIIVHHRCRTPS